MSIIDPSAVSFTAGTTAANYQTDCSWGGTSSCGASYCTDTSSQPKCDAKYLTAACGSSCVATSVNAKTQLEALGTQTCTQATAAVDERCSSTWLNKWMSVGRNGNGGAVAAYCTDKYLIIYGTGATGFTTNMVDISQAPGGKYYPAGDTTEVTCVTSEVTVSSPKMETTVIPLVSGDYKYTLLDTALDTNNMGSAAYDGAGDGNRKYLCNTNNEDCFGLPSWAGVGVTTTGQSIYPLYSNTVAITLDSCEVDSCNEHVGQGGGQPHLHGDPFHASDTKCHYGPANYTDGITGHPPVIGFSYDGPSIYGRYLASSAPGFSTGLDDCGGHVHDSYVYHYHTQVISATTSSGNKGINKAANTGKTYPAFTPGPYKCFKGDIQKRGTSVTNFDLFSNNAISNDQKKPCNGMTDYWIHPDCTFNGSAFTCTSTDTSTDTTTTTSSTQSNTIRNALQKLTLIVLASSALAF